MFYFTLEKEKKKKLLTQSVPTPCRQVAVVSTEPIVGEKNTNNHKNTRKSKMAVQETASQLSMALKVQEYPTLKVNES